MFDDIWDAGQKCVPGVRDSLLTQLCRKKKYRRFNKHGKQYETVEGTLSSV